MAVRHGNVSPYSINEKAVPPSRWHVTQHESKIREISRFQVTGVVMMSWAGTRVGRDTISTPKSRLKDRTSLLVLLMTHSSQLLTSFRRSLPKTPQGLEFPYRSRWRLSRS